MHSMYICMYIYKCVTNLSVYSSCSIFPHFYCILFPFFHSNEYTDFLRYFSNATNTLVRSAQKLAGGGCLLDENSSECNYFYGKHRYATRCTNCLTYRYTYIHTYIYICIYIIHATLASGDAEFW